MCVGSKGTQKGKKKSNNLLVHIVPFINDITRQIGVHDERYHCDLDCDEDAFRLSGANLFPILRLASVCAAQHLRVYMRV